MSYDFHIGNRKSIVPISNPGLRCFHGGNYNTPMAIARIGNRHPSQLFLREWIDERGLEQKQLAERMEIEPGTVSKLLNGRMKMTIEYLSGFSDALDLSVSDLFRHPKTPTQSELLAMGTPEQLRAAIQLIQTMRTGTDG